MADYNKTTDFQVKDSLPKGSPDKKVRGVEIDTEFNNIATSVATKVDKVFGDSTQIYVPDQNGNMVPTPLDTDQVVTLQDTQTLTNKTISGALISGGTSDGTQMINNSILSASIDTATIENSTLNSPTINSPTVTQGTFDNPTVTNGAFTNPVISIGTISGSEVQNSGLSNSTVKGQLFYEDNPTREQSVRNLLGSHHANGVCFRHSVTPLRIVPTYTSWGRVGFGTTRKVGFSTRQGAMFIFGDVGPQNLISNQVVGVAKSVLWYNTVISVELIVDKTHPDYALVNPQDVTIGLRDSNSSNVVEEVPLQISKIETAADLWIKASFYVNVLQNDTGNFEVVIQQTGGGGFYLPTRYSKIQVHSGD